MDTNNFDPNFAPQCPRKCIIHYFPENSSSKIIFKKQKFVYSDLKRNLFYENRLQQLRNTRTKAQMRIPYCR